MRWLRKSLILLGFSGCRKLLILFGFYLFTIQPCRAIIVL
jgi:hypothetical protein